MNTEDIIELYSIGSISREYVNQIFSSVENIDNERLMQITIEEMEN